MTVPNLNVLQRVLLPMVLAGNRHTDAAMLPLASDLFPAQAALNKAYDAPSSTDYTTVVAVGDRSSSSLSNFSGNDPWKVFSQRQNDIVPFNNHRIIASAIQAVCITPLLSLKKGNHLKGRDDTPPPFIQAPQNNFAALPGIPSTS